MNVYERDQAWLQLTWNHKRMMRRHNVVYAWPPRRYTFGGYGVYRRHEHFFNATGNMRPISY